MQTPAESLCYAPPTARPARARGTAILLNALLGVLLVVSAMLVVQAVRWDRWAGYENAHRPLWDGFGGESHSSFKAWQAWRACWDRGRMAATISAVAIVVAVRLVVHQSARGRIGRGVIVMALLHAGLIAYFAIRWGPDFVRPAANWGG